MEEQGLSKSMSKPKKTSEGKKKIDVTKKVMKKTSRQVMFSKRRKGLFKKCDELCYKFGAEIGLITFSEVGNCFPYGNPNLDYVIQRYCNYCSNSNYGGSVNFGGFWWDEVEVDKLGLSELEEFKVALEGLRNEVVSRVDVFSRGYWTSNQGFGFDNSMDRSRTGVGSSAIEAKQDYSMSNQGFGYEVGSSVVDMKQSYSMSNQGFGFDNSMERSRNEVVSTVDDMKQDYWTSNQGFGFDNSLERSRNEVVSTVDDMKQDYWTSNQGFGFDNSMERSRNEIVSTVDDIKQDFSMNNQGFGLDDFDFGGVFDGSFNDHQFGSDFDFSFGDLINNGFGPEVHVPDTSLLQVN